MKREDWIKHIEDTEGLIRPSMMGNRDLWASACKRHLDQGCPQCKDRRKTNRANASRKMREDALRSLGLTKVKGAVSGKTYWE